jgi:hypothetical protein
MSKRGKVGSVGDLVDILVYILFAVVVLPIIGGQLVSLEGDSTNFSTTEILLFGLVMTFIVLGIVYSIVKKML